LPSVRFPGARRRKAPRIPIRRPRRVAAIVLSFAAVVSTVWSAAAAQADSSAGFSPGAVWNDQNGNALQMHGLGILKVGGTWYAYGEDKVGENSSDATFRAVPCYSSTNLSTWTYQGEALTEQSSGDLGPGRIVERPKVIYDSSTGEYVMWMHIDNTAYSQAEAGVAQSPTPCGPYTYLGASQPLGFQSRDIGLFQDSNGAAYLLSEDRANGLRIDQLSSNYLSVVSAGSANGGSVALLPDYEAPALVKANGVYFILGSHLSGWATNDNAYATATSLSGPWSAFRDFAPAGTDTYNTQTANIIPVTGGSGTTYIYAGDRWNASDLGDSPLVWLPLTLSGSTAEVGWQNSWTLDLTTGLWTGSSNPASGTDQLANVASGLVLDINGASTATGGSAVQWTNHDGTNQQWRLASQGWNVYTLTNVNSGLCLDVPNNSASSGLQLDQWTCNGGTNQQWALAAVGAYTSGTDRGYELTSLESGLVVDVSGGSTAAGAAVIQWPTNGGSNQEWTLQ
jgi:Ricin-type beta-trefoil lectin domain/Glycosyl hydrolases family 43